MKIGDALGIGTRPLLAALEPSMSFVQRLVSVMHEVDEAACLCVGKQVDHVLIQDTRIGFEGQHILAVPLFDLLGDLRQAAYRVYTHDAACHLQLPQEEGQGSLLIGMLLHLSLGQHQVGSSGPGTPHLDGGLACCTITGAAGCLAINGDLLGGQDRVDDLYPREKTRLKLLRVQTRKNTAKGIM
jgi:hypothetical protein